MYPLVQVVQVVFVEQLSQYGSAQISLQTVPL